MMDMALSQFTVEKGELICESIEAGLTLREVEGIVGASRVAIFRWLENNEEFRNHYARARLNQAHSFADSIEANTKLMLAGELTPEQCRVANDAHKWMAGKRMPSVYGDTTKLELSGSINHTCNPAEALTTGTLEAIERELSQKALPEST